LGALAVVGRSLCGGGGAGAPERTLTLLTTLLFLLVQGWWVTVLYRSAQLYSSV